MHTSNNKAFNSLHCSNSKRPIFLWNEDWSNLLKLTDQLLFRVYFNWVNGLLSDITFPWNIYTSVQKQKIDSVSLVKYYMLNPLCMNLTITWVNRVAKMYTGEHKWEYNLKKLKISNLQKGILHERKSWPWGCFFWDYD